MKGIEKGGLEIVEMVHHLIEIIGKVHQHKEIIGKVHMETIGKV